MIPKIIHYCWFGKGEMTTLANKCLKSWKKYCPDYELMIWNEDNFDINSNQYVREAYENKKFAFVSDYVRLYALYNYGGIYMDTDVEMIKPIDDFLNCNAFMGFESIDGISTGIIASVSNLLVIKQLLSLYDHKSFYKDDGTLDFTTNVKIVTNFFNKKGLILNNQKQIIDGFIFYPSDFFSPIDVETRIKKTTKNTVVIHWFSGSWLSVEEKKKKKIAQKKLIIRKVMDQIWGVECSGRIIKFFKNTNNK